MTRSENPVAFTMHFWWIKLNVHELVHVSQDKHVAIQLHHSLVLGQREWSQLAPAVIKSRVLAEVLLCGGNKIFDVFFGDVANVESFVPFFWEAVRVERYQRVAGAVLFEGKVQCEQARQISCIRDECRPY